MRRTRYHYPKEAFPELIYTLVCQECGAERKSSTSPDSVRAPKLCAPCNRRKQNEVIHRLFEWPNAKRPPA